jgi:hypothetical protein
MQSTKRNKRARFRISKKKRNKRTVLRGDINLPSVAQLTTVARMPYESILLVVLASKSFETIPSTSFSSDTSPNNSLVKTYNIYHTDSLKPVYINVTKTTTDSMHKIKVSLLLLSSYL